MSEPEEVTTTNAAPPANPPPTTTPKDPVKKERDPGIGEIC